MPPRRVSGGGGTCKVAGRHADGLLPLSPRALCRGHTKDHKSCSPDAVTSKHRRLDSAEERAPLELDLLLALGPVRVVLEGYGAASVEATFARARELCTLEALAGYRFPVLRGLAAFHHLRADFETAHSLGTGLIAHGKAADPADDGYLVEGHLICGMVDFFRGRFVDADQALNRSIAHYDRERHAAHAHVHGIDPGTLGLGFEAFTSWMLGDSNWALARAEQALDLAAGIDHSFSLCQCHSMNALLHQFREDLQQTRYQSDLTAELAERFGFPYLVACEKARRGWLAVKSGEMGDGISDIREGMSLYRDTGAVGGLTVIMATLVEAYLLAGDTDRGLETADDALSLVRNNDEGVYEAELLRLRGELLRCLGDPDKLADAEECINSALATARRQQARPFEVRSAVSLARLWFEHDRRQEAGHLLLPISDQLGDYMPNHNLSTLYQELDLDPHR